MVYQQKTTDFTTPTRSKTPDMPNTNFTGTFPRMRDKTSFSQRPLSSIKSASTWNLFDEGKNKPVNGLKSGSSTSNLVGLDLPSLRPSISIFDTFGINEDNLNQLVPSLEQAWSDIWTTNNNSKHHDGTINEESGCMMTATNVFNETFMNCSANNAALKQGLALALELQNAINTLG